MKKNVSIKATGMTTVASANTHRLCRNTVSDSCPAKGQTIGIIRNWQTWSVSPEPSSLARAHSPLDEVHDLDLRLAQLVVPVGHPPDDQIVVMAAGPVRSQVVVVSGRWVGHRPGGHHTTRN